MAISPDYAGIAGGYDTARRSYGIDPDADLHKMLVTEPRRRLRVLDVGCGTGSWLAAQCQSYGDERIEFFGLDASSDMLSFARAKTHGMTLIHADAGRLPFGDSSFQLIVCNFAFHHFENKDGVASEMKRVLAPGGVLKIRNIDPGRMPLWWVYSLFPDTVAVDEARFWDRERLWRAFAGSGLSVRMSGTYEFATLRLDSVKARAEQRDISQLALLPEERYREGLKQIEQTLERQPDAEIFSEEALLTCRVSDAPGTARLSIRGRAVRS